MQFSQRHIDLAKELGRLRLSWVPAVGHYVFDQGGKFTGATCMQNGLFLIGGEAVLRNVAGYQRENHRLVWLPTWHDAKDILRSLGVSDADVELELVRTGAIAEGTELLGLYELIAQRLSDERLRVIYRVESATQVEC